MELQALGIVTAIFYLVLVLTCVNCDGSADSGVGFGVAEKLVLGQENLAPLASGLLKFDPVTLGSIAPSPGTKFQLVLAEDRTRRPDVLRKFRLYREGWDITNKHYWASVGFTGAAGFILAFLWFISFGLALGAHHFSKWFINLKEKGSPYSQRISLILLLIFTCAASTGCILLSVGQDGFHDKVLNTLAFVANQSDFTVEILTNVTEFLSLAKTINVDQVILPSNVQQEIDKLNVDLNTAAITLSDKTTENSAKMKEVLGEVRCALIIVAAVMLLLAVVGFAFSIVGYQNVIYIFILSGWLLVAVTFILCGVFLILDNAILDTCMAMDEWVNNPHAETALSDILPCVDERTSNLTLHRSKEVIHQLVNVVNTAIGTIANANNTNQQRTSYYYNQSGPLMPSLCSPYDSEQNVRQCDPQEVSLSNASSVWLNYTCMVSASGLCVSTGRVTPDIYHQLKVAVNASYALDHYTPLLLSLQDCNFVRDTFSTITSRFCPRLERNLKVVIAGLGMISAGIMLCLMLWILYANRPRREEVFVKISEVKVAKDRINISTGSKRVSP